MSTCPNCGYDLAREDEDAAFAAALAALRKARRPSTGTTSLMRDMYYNRLDTYYVRPPVILPQPIDPDRPQ